jgi:hypothetical protein
VSRSVDIFPECRFPVATRVHLFGALPDIGGLLEQDPAVPDVKQVQNLASENVETSLEEFHKRSEEDKTVWQREREEMQREVNRLREEVVATGNGKASLVEMCKKREEEEKALSQRERDEIWDPDVVIGEDQVFWGGPGGDAQEKGGGDGSPSAREGRDAAGSKTAARGGDDNRKWQHSLTVWEGSDGGASKQAVRVRGKTCYGI